METEIHLENCVRAMLKEDYEIIDLTNDSHGSDMVVNEEDESKNNLVCEKNTVC